MNGHGAAYNTIGSGVTGSDVAPVGAGMGTGVGIFLIALGAILTFAVNASVSGLDINAVGVILMVVGALGLVLDLVVFAPRRRAVAVTRNTSTVAAPVCRTTVAEDQVY